MFLRRLQPKPTYVIGFRESGTACGDPGKLRHPRTTIMPLFNRKNKKDETDEGGLDAEGKKKGAWKRPASKLARIPVYKCLGHLQAPTLFRYRVQAATAESLAAYPYSQDGSPHSVPHRHHLRTNWWPSDLGKQSSFANYDGLYAL